MPTDISRWLAAVIETTGRAWDSSQGATEKRFHMTSTPKDPASPPGDPEDPLAQISGQNALARQVNRRPLRHPAGVVTLGAGLSALSFCAAALSAAGTLVVAVHAGPSGYGPQASALGIATLGALLLDAGVSTVVQRGEARQPGAAREMVGRRYWNCVAILVVALLLALTAGLVTGLAVAYVAALATSLATTAALRGAHRFAAASLLSILDKGAACLAASLLVKTSPDAALLAAFTLGTSLQVLIALFLIRPPAKSGWSPRRILSDLTVGRHFLAASILNESQRLDVPIVNGVSGAAAAGIFAAPARITALLGTPANVLTGVLLTRMSSGTARSLREARIVALVLIVGYLALATVIAVVARPLTDLVLGKSYSSSASLVVVYGFAMLPASLNQLSSTILASRGRERQTVARVAITVPVSLALVAVGGALGGALWATAGFATGQLLLCGLLTPPALHALNDQKAGPLQR